MAAPSYAACRVRLKVASLHLAHGRFHEPGSVADQELSEPLCWRGLIQSHGLQPVYREVRCFLRELNRRCRPTFFARGAAAARTGFSTTHSESSRS